MRTKSRESCRTMYFIESETSVKGFRSRVVLRDATDGVEPERSFSGYHRTLKASKKEAAWIALRELQGFVPHEDVAIPLNTFPGFTTTTVLKAQPVVETHYGTSINVFV